MASALSIVAVLLIVGWLLRSRGSIARQENGYWVLEYPAAFRYLSVGFFAVPVAFGFLVLWFKPKPDERWIVLALGGSFLAFALWLGIEVFRRSYLVSSEGLMHRRPLGGPVFLSWSELTGIEYMESWQTLELRFGGRRVRLSRYLSGLNTLAEALRRYAPPQVATPAALNVVLTLTDS